MIFISSASGRLAGETPVSSSARPGPARNLAMLLALAMLAGCGSLGLTGGNATVATAPRPAPQSPDPIGGFGGDTSPGAMGTVVLADGIASPARMLRSYAAASGRECRELLVGAGTLSQSRLYCQAEGQWVAARPLLQGGGSGRP